MVRGRIGLKVEARMWRKEGMKLEKNEGKLEGNFLTTIRLI